MKRRSFLRVGAAAGAGVLAACSSRPIPRPGVGVLVVGGGVAGCAVGYFLALQGLEVTLAERHGVAGYASGHAAGQLSPLAVPEPVRPLAAASFGLHLALWDHLRTTSGVDFEARRSAMIRLALDRADLPALERALAATRRDQARLAHALDLGPGHGLDVVPMSGDEVRALEPRISDEVVAALRTDGNAVIDSRGFTTALLRSAQRAGLVARRGEVGALVTSGRRVTEVDLGGARVRCEALVIATGPWAGALGRRLDLLVPIEPIKGELLHLDLAVDHDVGTGVGNDRRGGRDADLRTGNEDGAGPAVDWSGPDSSLYARGGRILVGHTWERRGFDLVPRADTRDLLLAHARRLMPAVATAQVLGHTACLRPVPRDGRPLIGRAPGWDNVYLAAGGGKKGILLSLAMGRAVTELIAHGRTELPIAACAPDRFARTYQVPSP
ncbi:NAD(P)/FAD-dependent oxidoreductase [Haliangium sp.]|uniref:NAD(P)/FAD-dependent oxidoreductase n=1 Tax=Haliangium sp. TaxID=2663208 RepID=UPI003D13692C